MKQYYSSIAAADLSASAATTETLSVPFAGKIRLDESYIRVGEAVGAATTAATVTISVAGTARGTATPSTALTAVGDCQVLTAVSGGNKYINFDAGDDIVMAHTQATGGTVTGTAYFHLSLEYAI
jgi:hypothetical protein